MREGKLLKDTPEARGRAAHQYQLHVTRLLSNLFHRKHHQHHQKQHLLSNLHRVPFLIPTATTVIPILQEEKLRLKEVK